MANHSPPCRRRSATPSTRLSKSRLSTVESYDPATNSWTTEAPLQVAKARPASALLKTTIVAAGGVTDSGVTGDNEGYDASTNVWSSLTDDPMPRSHTCNGVVNGALYSAGGANTPDNALAVNEAFNLSRNSWTTKASIPQAAAAAGSAVYNGLLYCFGGSFEEFDSPGHSLQRRSDLPTIGRRPQKLGTRQSDPSRFHWVLSARFHRRYCCQNLGPT